MSLKTPLLFAGVIIAIAVLAVFDIVPEAVSYTHLTLPTIYSV